MTEGLAPIPVLDLPGSPDAGDATWFTADPPMTYDLFISYAHCDERPGICTGGLCSPLLSETPVRAGQWLLIVATTLLAPAEFPERLPQLDSPGGGASPPKRWPVPAHAFANGHNLLDQQGRPLIQAAPGSHPPSCEWH